MFHRSHRSAIPYSMLSRHFMYSVDYLYMWFCYLFIICEYFVAGEAVSNWDPNSELNPEELGEYAQGDILFPSNSSDTARNGLRAASAHWPKAVVPYEVNPYFSEYPFYHTHEHCNYKLWYLFYNKILFKLLLRGGSLFLKDQHFISAWVFNILRLLTVQLSFLRSSAQTSWL